MPELTIIERNEAAVANYWFPGGPDSPGIAAFVEVDGRKFPASIDYSGKLYTGYPGKLTREQRHEVEDQLQELLLAVLQERFEERRAARTKPARKGGRS
jgi:hypothetical protein